MNGGKFARLTAELLVRKGKSRPPHAGASVVNFPPRQQRPEPRNAEAQPRGDNVEPIAQAAAAPALRENEPHEAGLLKLDISRARNELKWQPKLNAQQAIEYTIDWYKQSTEILASYTFQQIDNYFSL